MSDMSFSPTNDCRKDITKDYLKSVMEKWNLYDSFKENKITFAVDGALYTYARELYTDLNLTPRVNICTPHNFGNISERSLEQNLITYWPEGPSKIKVISLLSLIQY